MISEHAVVKTSDIGKNVQISEFVVVRENVKIGNDVIIHPNVVIGSGTIIGDGVEIFPGAFIGKEPKGAGVLARRPVFDFQIFIGANTSIGPNAIIYYDVKIGENTLIGDGVSIREKSRIGSRNIIGRYVAINYAVTTGDRVRIMDHSWLAGNMNIGNDVAISGGVLTTNDNDIGRGTYREELMQGPTIEDGSRIGAGAILLPNVIIGKNSIIGAGSVVTKNVGSYTVVMGLPAKLVRELEKE